MTDKAKDQEQQNSYEPHCPSCGGKLLEVTDKISTCMKCGRDVHELEEDCV